MTSTTKRQRARATVFLRACFFVLFCALFCASCGIFSPRPAENPTVTAINDPFNFASLLYNTGKTFSRLDYNELFAGDPDGQNIVYSDIEGRQFTKKDLVAHLTQVQQTLSIKTAIWKPDPQTPDLSIADTILILNRLDSVVAVDSLSKVLVFAGKASFTVVKNSTINAWTILEWKDNYPGPDVSIFHPWYVPK
jgi:hypothetical protein